MKIRRLQIKFHWFKNNIGKKIGIIPANTHDSKGFILDFFDLHIFVDYLSKEWFEKYGRK